MNATAIDLRGVVEVCGNCGQKNRLGFSNLGSQLRCGSCKHPLGPPAEALELEGEAVFDSLIETARLPVLVDFWAEWCGPCKMMAPEFQKLAAKTAGRCLLAKINTEGAPALAERHQIAAIPTLVLFHGGREIARTQGAQPAAQLQHFIERALRGAV